MRRALLLGLLVVGGCRPFDEVLDDTLQRLADAGLVADAGREDAGAQDSGVDPGTDAGPTPDAGGADDAGAEPDAGSSTDGGVDAGSGTDAGVDAGSGPDAGPRCRLLAVTPLTALAPNESFSDLPVAVASADEAWFVAAGLATGAMAVGRVEGGSVGPPSYAGCGGACRGVSAATVESDGGLWYAFGWSARTSVRFSFVHDAMTHALNNSGSDSLGCGGMSPDVTVVNGDVVAAGRGATFALGCFGGFTLRNPEASLTTQGDYFSREVRTARNRAGQAWLAYTTDAGFRATPLDVAAAQFNNTIPLTTGHLTALGLAVGPDGAPWLTGVNPSDAVQLYTMTDAGLVDVPLQMPFARASVQVPVGVAAGADGVLLVFKSAVDDSALVLPVRYDGGTEPTLTLTTSGNAPQVAWSPARQRYGLTWNWAGVAYLRELECRDE